MARELELAQAVTLVRDELLRAAAAGADRELRFEVGPIGMEFTVELREDARARGGFRAWVVSAEADAGLSRARTHKVTFTLTPRTADGGPVEIAWRDAEMAGDSLFRPPTAD